MTAECTFALNGQSTSTLDCVGLGAIVAFSGNGSYVNDPKSTALPNSGPLPAGIYYIVDRQSGGHMGWLNDLLADFVAGTHRVEWFALYRDDGIIDDWTSIDGIRRGHFRLHPAGYWGTSEGCITLPHKSQFDMLRKFLKSQPAGIIPSTGMKYYGRVLVQ